MGLGEGTEVILKSNLFCWKWSYIAGTFLAVPLMSVTREECSDCCITV